jgi:hypothetical protein
VQFEHEHKELQCALAPWLAGSIEHIGSTAIPVLRRSRCRHHGGVETLDASRPAIAAMTDLGYCYAPYQ